MTTEQLWVGFGLVGQLLFTGRFLVQWLTSERQRKSVIPVTFWYLSIAGGVVLLTYAVYRRDPVFILGQSTGVFIYVRNLQLLSRNTASQGSRPESRATLPLQSLQDSFAGDSPAQPAA